MIRCRLELVPGGLESDDSEPIHLGTIIIGNQIGATLASGGKRGDYYYELKKKRRNRIASNGIIRDFPRQSYHPWNLVRRILDDAAETNGGTI